MTKDAEVKAGTFLPVRGHVDGRTFRADDVIRFFFLLQTFRNLPFSLSSSYPCHIHIYHDLADLGGTNIVEGDRFRREACDNK